MFCLTNKVVFSICLLISLVSCKSQQDERCTITEFSKVPEIVKNCTDIIISNLTVPTGKHLILDLLKGSKVTFEGVTTFEVGHWEGYFIRVFGEGVLVEGAPGSVLYAQGDKYWDGQGGSGGVKKPKFFLIKTTGGSIFRNIYLWNCAHWCVVIQASDLTISGWTIDVVAGNTRGGANTDGFGIESGNNILIENSVVMNQDDCVVVRKGSDMVFRNLQCYGSHGLSFSIGDIDNENEHSGIIKNITFTDCLVANGLNGIHIKSKKGTGTVTNVTYKNIEILGIQQNGIYIDQDYGDRGNLSRQIEIKNLKIENVYGSVQGEHTYPVNIACNHNKCSNWTWSGINILGGGKSQCNFLPSGFSC